MYIYKILTIHIQIGNNIYLTIHILIWICMCIYIHIYIIIVEKILDT